MRLLLSTAFLLPLGWLGAADTPKKEVAPAETVQEQFAKRAARLWSLQPVTRPPVPAGVTAPRIRSMLSSRRIIKRKVWCPPAKPIS